MTLYLEVVMNYSQKFIIWPMKLFKNGRGKSLSLIQRTNGHDITHDVQEVVDLVVREDRTTVTTTATSRDSNASSCHPTADCRNNEEKKNERKKVFVCVCVFVMSAIGLCARCSTAFWC
jgi:hypothetical protein